MVQPGRSLLMGFGIRTAVILAAALASLLGPATARGQEWQFELTPYLWLTGIDGDVGVKGSPTVSVSADAADILKNLDFGALVLFDAKKGPWLLMLDTIFTKLSQDGDTRGSLFSRIDVDTRMAVITPALGYQV